MSVVSGSAHKKTGTGSHSVHNDFAVPAVPVGGAQSDQGPFFIKPFQVFKKTVQVIEMEEIAEKQPLDRVVGKNEGSLIADKFNHDRRRSLFAWTGRL